MSHKTEPNYKTAPKKTNTKPTGKVDLTDLHLPPYLNGSVLTAVLITTVFGMIISIPPIMSRTIAADWPFPEPGAITISLLFLALLSVITLFHQQRFVVSSHERYESARAEELEHAQRNIDRLQALLDVSHAIGTADNLISVFDHITKTCADLFECHQSSLMIFDRPTEELVVRSVGGRSARAEVIGKRQPLGQGIAGWAAERRQALLLSRDFDPSKYPGLKLRSKTATSAMVVPILLGDALVGVLNVSSQSKEMDYNKEDLGALEVFAESVGTYIRHTEKMYSMKDTIRSLEKALREAQSPATLR